MACARDTPEGRQVVCRVSAAFSAPLVLIHWLSSGATDGPGAECRHTGGHSCAMRATQIQSAPRVLAQGAIGHDRDAFSR